MSKENQELVKRAEALIDQVSYEDYTFTVSERVGGVFLHANYDEECVIRNVIESQQTRPWRLSPKMGDSEIVSTAFKCCITSAEHRCREAFSYRGERIFGPHFDVEDLVDLCKSGRANAGSRNPA